VAPHAVLDLLLVATNLEPVILAELVENTSGAVVELIDGLAGRRVLDLVSLENLLGLLRVGLGNRGGKHLPVKVLHAPEYEYRDFLLDVGVETVLGNEVVDAGFDGSHFEDFVYENSENGLLLLITPCGP